MKYMIICRYVEGHISRDQLFNYLQDSNEKITYFKFTLCWPRLNMFVEAPQAQVSRVNIYLHSVGQDLTCLLKPHRHR